MMVLNYETNRRCNTEWDKSADSAGWGPSMAFSVGIGGYKDKIRRLINDRDQPSLCTCSAAKHML